MARLPHVNYDLALAGAAAAACEETADDLRTAATLLGGTAGDLLASWSGDSRLSFDTAASDLAEELRSRARALDDTADDIRSASTSASMANFRRQEAIDAEARRIEELARQAEAAAAARATP